MEAPRTEGCSLNQGGQTQPQFSKGRHGCLDGSKRLQLPQEEVVRGQGLPGSDRQLKKNLGAPFAARVAGICCYRG